MPRQLSEIDQAVVAALCREYIEGRRVPSPATPDQMLAELPAQGINLDVDALRARLRHLCSEYGVEEDRPDVMRAELVKRLGEDGWIRRPSSATAGPDRDLLVRLKESGRWLLGRLQQRRRLAGLSVGTVLVVGVVVLVWLNGSGSPQSNRSGYVLDPADMAHAHGQVRYCTGGSGNQKNADVEDFNRRYKQQRLQMRLVGLGNDSNVQLDTLQGYERTRQDRCDVVLADLIWMSNLVQNDWLYDLSRYYTEQRKDEFIPSMLAAATIGGRTWGIPTQADAGLLFYRADRVARAPTTWQALYGQAAAGPKPLLRYQGLAYEGLTVNFLEIATAAGAKDIVTRRKANINQKPALRALRFMVDGIGQAVPREVVDQKEQKNKWAFGHGRASFMRNWPSYEKELLQEYPRLRNKVRTAPLPSWRGGQRGSVLGGHILVIPRLSKNPAAALKAVAFLSSAKIMKRGAIKSSVAPALVDLWNDPEVQRKLPSADDLEDEIRNATLRPVVPNYQAVSEAIYSNVNRALRRDVTPEHALELANDQINQALADSPSR